MGSKLTAVVILTSSGILAGAISAPLTLALIPRFSVCFSVPDHPHSYALWNLKTLLVLCASLGGAIGLSISWGLAWTRGLWTRALSSLLLAFLLISVLLHGLKALRAHGFPDLAESIHIALAACFLGLPPVLFLTLAQPVLAKGRPLNRLWMISLPLYALLGGLSSWSFWYFYSEPRTHFVVGWIDGALFGLFHGLGMIAVKLLHREEAFDRAIGPTQGGNDGDSIAPTGLTTVSGKPVFQPAIVSALVLSLLVFGMGLSSLIAARSKALSFQPSDRQALLTIDDLTGVIKNWVPERSAETFSKVLHAKGTHELRYEYKDPAGKVSIFCISKIEPSTDDAQTAYWGLRDLLRLATGKFRPLRVEVRDLFQWGDECTIWDLAHRPESHGVAFAGHKGRRAIFLVIGTEEPFEKPETLTPIILSILRRFEGYIS